MKEDLLQEELKLLRERGEDFHLTLRNKKYILEGKIAQIPVELELPEDFPENPPTVRISCKSRFLSFKISRVLRKLKKLETIRKWKPTFNLYMVISEIKNNLTKLDEKELKKLRREINKEKEKKEKKRRKEKKERETSPFFKGIQIYSGYERTGECLKVGIKIKNNLETIISDVLVRIIIPDGLEFIEPKSGTVNIKTIKKGESQSAIFRLRPIRCVDGLIYISMEYIDAHGIQRWLKIKPLRITNICPMLTSENVNINEILQLLKTSALEWNSMTYTFDTFESDPKIVFKMAIRRVSGLILIDKCEEEIDDSYLAYACYIGRTKYKNFKFAVEINVSARNRRGILSIITYSDEERILTGFFAELMRDLKKHIKVVEEKEQEIINTCKECGRLVIPPIPPKYIINTEKGIIQCKACEAPIKIPKWKIKDILKS